MTRPASTGRDLRLDFFRGLGLLFIFLDHIPDNWVSYLTLANVPRHRMPPVNPSLA